jgi:FAD/FMN-containing dehydrogenase
VVTVFTKIHNTIGLTCQFLKQLSDTLEGSLLFDDLHKKHYATDASAYRIVPLAVYFALSEADIVKLIHFANQHKISLIPRTAGTSLAGQTVGRNCCGCVQYFTKIIAFDPVKKQLPHNPE